MRTRERRLTAFAPNEKFGADSSALVASATSASKRFWIGTPSSVIGAASMARHRGLVGLVPEASIRARFYDDYHRSLATEGVGGVKVESQATLEGLAVRQGGRVRLTRAYREALERSVARHLEGRLFTAWPTHGRRSAGSPGSTLTRSSIDVFPQRPETHSAHLYANAQVGLWFGQFRPRLGTCFRGRMPSVPFTPQGAQYRAGPSTFQTRPASTISSSGALVCSDGSVLHADGPGLPTLDTLCVDPTREPVPLEVWNRSGRAGIVGAFHARYAAGRAEPVAGQVRPSDVRGLGGERFACYAFRAARLDVLGHDDAVSFCSTRRSSSSSGWCPIERGFAALGLGDKLNGPKARLGLDWHADGATGCRLRDGGAFLGYAERPPRAVTSGADGCSPAALPFSHDPERRLLRVELGAARTFTVCW